MCSVSWQHAHCVLGGSQLLFDVPAVWHQRFFVLLWQISVQLYVGREKALTLVCVQSMQLSTSATLCRTLPTPASPQPSSRCWTSG